MNENGKSQDADTGKGKKRGRLFRVAPTKISYHTNIGQVNGKMLQQIIFSLLHYFEAAAGL